MSVTSWFLVSSSGTRHRLPREMIFVGRDDCELMLQSRSVDKQHAVINYDPNADEHMVKDLGSLNGTFVNDLRIPDQTYITLKLSDVIRFGYDAHVYILEKSQHKVPEEALKHEKYTSQLQLGLKALDTRAKEKQQSPEKSKEAVSNVKLHQKSERKALSLTAATDTPISKQTPLYGQPSWWGEDEDSATKIQKRSGKSSDLQIPESGRNVSSYELSGSLSDNQGKSIFSYRREPSYFEIPTKEIQHRPTKKAESQVHEVPTKDTQDPSDHVPSTPTPPVVQSHASFTIEFDECNPGKMKIKDHVTKFSFRQQRKPPPAEAVTTPTEVMSAESKVADWLVQSTANMMRRRSQGDIYSPSSDPSLLLTTKARYENGTDIQSEDPTINEQGFLRSQVLIDSQISSQPQRVSSSQRFTEIEQPSSYCPPEFQSASGKADPHRAFIIEFYDDHSADAPRRKCSQTIQSDQSNLRVHLEKARKSSTVAGEKQVQSPACRTPPSQRYTIPLKAPASISSSRGGSLRREKTEDRINTGFSSRSASAISARPFSSVGRRSKLAKEFTAEWLKQTKQTSSSEDKNISSPPTKPKTETSAASQPDLTVTNPAQVESSLHPKTSSPIQEPVPLTVPTIPLVCQSEEVKHSHVGPRNPEDDSLSDAGTYTIEADISDKELEEARKRIDKVFGVVENPERTNHSEADTSAAFRPIIFEGREEHRQSSDGEVRTAPQQGASGVKVQLAGAVMQGAPKWMSCWASLADVETGPSSGQFHMLSQMELSGSAQGTRSQDHDSVDSEGPRARPNLGEKSDIVAPSIHVHHDPHSTFEVEESGSVTTGSHDGIHRLSVQDDVEPDSLSDASKSDDGSVVERRKRPLSDTGKRTNEDEVRQSEKSKAFYIDSEDDAPQLQCRASNLLNKTVEKTEKKRSTKTFSTATLTKRRGSQESGKVRPTMSASLLVQETENSESKDCSMSSLIRQESFTKEQPSSNRLPNISSHGDLQPDLFQPTCSQDTHSYLKDTEDVLAVLEAKLLAGQSETTPSPIPDSLSGESDVDSSSTLSQQSSRTRSNPQTKNSPSSGLQRETSSASTSSHYSNPQSSVLSHQRIAKTEPLRRAVGLRRSVGKCGSAELSDDPQSSNVPYSDQESNSTQVRKKSTVPFQREDAKSSKVHQSLSRVHSFSAPRPTRASMLRRARLGDASDNETTETERLSQETTNIPAKENKKLSRWDMLAMPRRRTSSFQASSDTENSSAPQLAGKTTTVQNRNMSALGSKPGLKPSLTKTPITRGRSSSAKYASSTASSRRRQKGSGYASTSDEEYDSNRSVPKHKRSQPSSASHSPHRPPRPVVPVHPKSHNKNSQEENQEGEDLNSWSTHSAEIARLSQDLAKDLAILAREIHDVTGEGDGKNLTVQSSVPISAVTAHEKLVERIPEMGLNYRRVPPCSPAAESYLNSNDQDLNSTRQYDSREEVTVEDPALNPLSQVIMAIRENTEQLSEKIKVLFHDRMDVWEQIETNVDLDSDGPVGKAFNKDIAILKELRRVQRQLEVINTVMEPSWQLDARSSEPEVTSIGVCSARTVASRDWRTVHSVSKRGGGRRPGESVRRAAVTPEDVREGRLV
ncbi:centrosomal protein of 170 kDa protein B isoform X2 [Corythoichthys intestinalis]|uniref:centrosomal protein of 170 kDa protein B isoform X2 n=1 Tax=Corythoichthys intestinalis TaxID=161448 RepID=UPI0025A5126B|nr:centrosomal protein of 170 kDa protein B isoform X2 [Corythoichthys intestinalis]